MNKLIKKIFMFIIVILLVVFPAMVVVADSGFDSDYDSGGSDWSSSDSWSSSDDSWSDSDSGGSYSSELSGDDAVIGIIIFIMIILYAIFKKSKKIPASSISTPIVKKKISDEEIKKIDAELNTDIIVSKTFNLYKELQNAWMEFDNDKIRTLVSDELFNAYKMQLNTLKTNGQKNIMEDITKVNGYVSALRKEGNIETADVVLSVTMRDYIVNKYNAVVRGNKNINEITYFITIDKVNDEAKRITNCPNCGGALNGDASQKCEHCGSNLVLESKNFIITKKQNLGQGYTYPFNKVNSANQSSSGEPNINDFDKSIDNSMFKTKVDNLFVQLYTGLSNGDLKDVKHKISDNVYIKYNSEVEKNNNENVKHIFGELNVKSTEIVKVEYKLDKIVIEVKLVSRYMDYFVNKDNNQFVRGNNTSRIEHVNTLILEKNRNAKDIKASMYCPGCGQPANVNESGHCKYCGATFNMEDYDYILSDIEVK